ncbi:hypothetical protein CLAFUW4_06601 [Fulvia fulva]|uniref:Nucleoside 2-deoxyribosyltransferase n=1 Tax=Passalora fulva TaxID=5499 RepID=A0A9Q8UQN9_PASFU|nr:uncharacterized protein CLAFUR5_06746 [Fulvia fulva]KAK4621411.1 hypothetical protein CLAFUR4_06609 [Fulvia fulva]KAK4623395.1 hypothetical protein CLAFUR0_06603 [Fulvia fulva]UJO18867.1 hypothetical protein CLAFUR5_06746 [Fulvia fulva]WPV16654.1 hypothetical protein CLAFUW4_06601 [Fulvia fulva]WPV31008.1 hypothetical protein CLAFUW7_06600 [Fulvia fulva]
MTSNNATPVLATHIDRSATQNKAGSGSYTYYHAGPLFTIGDLHTNVLLSRAISRLSNGKFRPLLPQDLEQRGHVTPQNIRDKDIRALLNCDLALFTYDGAELDSGTVVEFMIAKMADIPCVILRSDFRHGGDQASKDSAGQPWNLMSSFWPRTNAVVVDAMLDYKQALAVAIKGGTDGAAELSHFAGESLIGRTAKRCVDALDEVLKLPSRMPKELRESVYRWLALMPGYAEGDDAQDVSEAISLLAKKEAKGLLQ